MPSRVLAIDLSGPGGGAALLAGGETERRILPEEVRRGRDLLIGVHELLAGRGLGPKDLDLVACGVGPGSFTGIRIAVATCATLAWAAGLPVLGVGSLHGLAANAPADAPWVLAAVDARRDHVYSALFRREGGELVERRPCSHLPPAEAAAALPAGTFVVGDAHERYPDPFGRLPGRADAPPRPDVLARIAAARFADGERQEPFELRPLYLRLSDPEIRRRGRQENRNA